MTSCRGWVSRSQGPGRPTLDGQAGGACTRPQSPDRLHYDRTSAVTEDCPLLARRLGALGRGATPSTGRTHAG
jgi:hypothetical protein